MKEKLDVLVIAHYSGAGSQSNNRFREVATLLSEAGCTVELVTSSFQHGVKRPRDVTQDIGARFKITYISEPGYTKNLSLRRVLSHHKMSKNLAKYLSERAAPDVIYCALPSTSVGKVAVAYAKKNRIRLILDIQDLWPEAFEIAVRPRKLAKVLFAPMKYEINKVYASADKVVTVSNTYSQRVLESGQSAEDVHTVYLGTDLKQFDRHPPQPFATQAEEISLVYIGTLGHNYNLPIIFNALRILSHTPLKVSLHIMGSGPLEEKWRISTKDLLDRVHFHGRLEYSDMVSRLQGCDIAINPIVPGAAGSIINKVCDYAAAGLPVINTQESPEYRDLLESFKAGINCTSTPSAVAEAILVLAQDIKLREEYSRGARLLAETHFNRAETYPSIVNLVLDHE